MKKFLFLIVSMLTASLVNATGVPVLMYHRIQPEATDLNVPIALFREHLDAIQHAGYKTITVSELAQAMSRGKTLDKTVVITFDDGWRDCLQAAIELERRKMTATFYIISGASQDPQYLTDAEIEALSHKFEIGAHTHTHFMAYTQDLSKISLLTFAGEMALSKNLIEHVIKKPVKTFAWPFGHYTQEAVHMAKKIGFESTVMVSNTIQNQVDPMRIDRINADGRCSGQEIVKSLQTGQSCR